MDFFTVYTYTNADYLAKIFNAVAMINNTGIVKGLSSSILAFTVIYIAWQLGIGQRFQKPLNLLAWLLLVVSFNSHSSVTVKVKNVTNELDQQVIKHVPMPLAAIASVSSTGGYYVTKVFEQAFSSVDHTPYTETGMLFGSKLAVQSSQIRIQDPYFNNNMKKYVQNCAMFDAMVGHKYTTSDLMNHPNIWALISKDPSQILGIKYKSKEALEFKTCRETAALLNTQWAGSRPKALEWLSKKLGGEKKLANNNIVKYLPIAHGVLSQNAGNRANLLQQDMMINAVKDASREKLHALGGNGATYAKAMHSLYSNFMNLGEMAANNIPLLKSVLEAVLYGSFFIIFLLMFLPSGYRYALNYMGILFWIQTWPIFFAIINLITQTAAGFVLKDSAITILNRDSLISHHHMMMALSGYLSFMVTYLSYVILKGGAASFMHLSNSFSGPAQGASAAAAGEISSGSLSLGNVSMGNRSMMNYSAFKHDSNVSHMSGEYSRNDASGMKSLSAVEGSFHSGESSHLNISGNLNQDYKNSASKAYDRSLNLTESTGASFSKSQSVREENAVSYLAGLTQTASNQSHWSEESSATNNEHVDQMVDYAKRLHEEKGLSVEESARTSIEASAIYTASGGIKAFGIGMTGELSAKTDYAEGSSSSASNHLSAQSGGSQSESHSAGKQAAYNALYSSQLNEGFEENQSLHNTFNQSHDNTQSLSQEHAFHKQETEGYRRVQEEMKSQGVSFSENHTDAFLDHAANNFALSKHDAAKLLHASSPDNPQAGNLKQEILSSYIDYLKDNYFDQHNSDLTPNEIQHNANVSDLVSQAQSSIDHQKDAHQLNVERHAENNGFNNQHVVDLSLKDAVPNQIAINQEEIQMTNNSLQSGFQSDLDKTNQKMSAPPRNNLWDADRSDHKASQTLNSRKKSY